MLLVSYIRHWFRWFVWFLRFFPEVAAMAVVVASLGIIYSLLYKR